MKLTLHDLNERIWYRLLKVVYIGSYLVLFAIGILLSDEAGHYEIQPNLPTSAHDAIADENFYLLSASKMASVLTDIDPDFANLSGSEQQKVITTLKEKKNKNVKGPANFTYLSRWDVSLSKAISYALTYFSITFAVMEFVRRCFFYVLTGRIFPGRKMKG